MRKFHLNKVIREANKAKKSLVNQIKHNLVFGNPELAFVDERLSFLSLIGEPSFRKEYEWIESQRLQGLKIGAA